MADQVLKNFINGEWVESKTEKYLEIKDPALDETVALNPKSTPEELEAAVKAAKDTFWSWRLTPPPRRQKMLFKFHEKLNDNADEIARIISLEHGKTIAEAKSEIVRGLEYVEHAAAISELLKGAYSEDVGPGVDTMYIREPLGPFVILPPFNFPAMISLYFVWAIASGNTAIIKPSRLCPMTSIKLVELLEECGLPKGVVNVLNGTGELGNALIMHPDTVGVTFVGSSRVAEIVYKTAVNNGKRAQCQGGANNFAVVARDANLDAIMDNLVNSCFGHSSQRCFAVSNILAVEEVYEEVKERFIAHAKKFVLGRGADPGVTMGPVVSRDSLNQMLDACDSAIKAGAKMVLDGRNPKVEKYPSGYFLGPTVLEAEPGMYVFDEEVFGPVRCFKKVKNLAEAVNVINQSTYGHTAVIYTENGSWAREFIRRVDTGQVGVNVGTPAPIAFYPVGGRKTAMYGDIRGRASDCVDFYTDKKVVTMRWHTPFEEGGDVKAEKLF